MPPLSSLQSRLQGAPYVDLKERIMAQERLQELVSEAPSWESLLQHPPTLALLLGVAAHSPYLWGLIRADLTRSADILRTPPEQQFQAILSKLHDQASSAQKQEDIRHALRMAKQSVALLVALADVGGVWSLHDVMQALSHFADSATQEALNFLLRKAHLAGHMNLPDLTHPGQGSGLVILALGKHGARELNYSSDIDLVVLYDPETKAIEDPLMMGPIYVKITKALAALLQERTPEGYVFRVDLRLRPDPGSTAVAISLPSAFSYYETIGQNWERAAFIKARPVAGDLVLGENFLQDLSPFIWRKYFDYAAIADIHAMKRQIQAFRGQEERKLLGQNIKLGRGGIREIEFFVQTQQLIFGGRRPPLRGAQTMRMLETLAQEGWIPSSTAHALLDDYITLRTIEHRLQMLQDEQTQTLPSSLDSFTTFAHFCGYEAAHPFEADLRALFERVEGFYTNLFAQEEEQDPSPFALLFHRETSLETKADLLQQLGFRDISRAADIVEGWVMGRRAALQSMRALEALADIGVDLLRSLVKSGEGDTALLALDDMLASMPAAAELFSILKSNPKMRALFCDILGGAPRLAHIATKRPHVLDGAIDSATFLVPYQENICEARFKTLQHFKNKEEFLDGLRDLVHEDAFLIGLQTFSKILDPLESGRAYALLARYAITSCLDRLEEEFRMEYGQIPGGACLILGMGRLGSQEMTATSDLDLILLYTYDEAQPESTGPRPLHASVYYTRLTQRLISALTVTTKRGQLYEVDMRLRPSGKKGPVATSLHAFEAYQAQEADTWEHMALTRARILAYSKHRTDIASKVTHILQQMIGIKRKDSALRKDIKAMRDLIAQEKGEMQEWDLKLVAGGLLDIEFLTQYGILAHAHHAPFLREAETCDVLQFLRENNVVNVEECLVLKEAYTLYSRVLHMLRLTLGENFDPQHAASSTLRHIAGAVDMPDFSTLTALLRETRNKVRRIFKRLMS